MEILKSLRHWLTVVTLFFIPAFCFASTSYFGMDAGFKTGKFGTTVRTDLYSINLSAGRFTPEYNASIAIPFHSLKNEGIGTTDGMGDIVLRLGRNITSEPVHPVAINATLAIKFPTADEKAGLGTGETDIGALFTLSKKWNTYRGSLGVGYTKIGDSETVKFNDVINYSVSLYKNFQRHGIYTSLEHSESMTNDIDDPAELNIGGFYFITTDISFTANIFTGLNDASPDYGVKMGVFNWRL